ncbi:MAG: MarC family protein [Deltaproteobacteria bacterium]
MSEAQIATFAVAMLAITNPIGNLAIFAGLTGDKTAEEKKKTAFVAGLAILIILIIVTWSGELILKAFGINIAAFETAGGLIIALIGLSMLHAKTSGIHHSPEEHEEAKTKDSVAVVPIAIPIVAGPGAITTIVVQVQKSGTIEDKIVITVVSIAISLLLWLCFYFSGPVSRLLGVTGINIVTRIMGIILAAIAFQMLASGLRTLFPGWA